MCCDFKEHDLEFGNGNNYDCWIYCLLRSVLHGHGHDTDTNTGIWQFLKNKDTA